MAVISNAAVRKRAGALLADFIGKGWNDLELSRQVAESLAADEYAAGKLDAGGNLIEVETVGMIEAALVTTAEPLVAVEHGPEPVEQADATGEPVGGSEPLEIAETTEDAHRTPPRDFDGLDGETVEPRETDAAQGAPASRAEVFAEAVGIELPKPTRPASKPPKPAKDAADDMPTLWGLKEASAFLKKGKRWLQYACRIPANEPGSIPHFRLGRSPRFDPEIIREWLLAGSPPAETFMKWQKRKSV